MPDREEIIKGIKECNLNGGLIGNCPYKGILALLKEQEDGYKNILSDYEDLAREHEKLLNKKIPLITNGQEVVRCKDCRWGDWARNGFGENMILCYNGNTGIEDGYLQEPNWFCAEGERK